MPQNGLLALILGFMFAAPVTAPCYEKKSESAELPTVAFERRFDQLRLPTDALRLGTDLYVVDEKANEVVVFDEQGSLLRRIGSVGSGAGEFLHPMRIVADGKGTLFVYDYGNERVQALDRQGAHLATLPIFDFKGFAATHQGDVLIGKPESGRLVEVYGGRNGRLKRQFGELRKTSDIYGEEGRSQDGRNRLLINRIFIEVDAQSNVYLTFRFAPVVQKYDPQGRLLWERRLHGVWEEKAAQRFITDANGADNYVKTAMDGRAANLVCLGAAYDASRQRLYVLMPGYVVSVLDSQGQQLSSFKPSTVASGPFIPFGAAWADGGELILVDILERVIWIGHVPDQGGE